MAKASTKAPEVPGSDQGTSPKATGSSPNRAKRYSFFEDGKDVVILSVQRQADGSPAPNGALSPIPDTPRFETWAEAKRWVTASGDKLQGMTVIVSKMLSKMSVTVEQKPLVQVTEDPRFSREATPAEAAETEAAPA